MFGDRAECLQFQVIDIASFALVEPVKEKASGFSIRRYEDSGAAALSIGAEPDAFLDEATAQFCIDQSMTYFERGRGEHSSGDSGPSHPAREVPRHEDPHRTLLCHLVR